MKHPRSLYLSVTSKHRLKTEYDYLDPKKFEIVSKMDSKFHAIEKLLTTGDTSSDRLKKSYEIFKNPNTKIFIEGLLFNYSIEQILELENYDKETLEGYLDYFFDVSQFKKGTFFSHIFLHSIIEDEIYQYFERLNLLKISDLKHFLKRETEERTCSQVLNKIKNEGLSQYDIFTSYFQNFLTSEFATTSVDKIPHKYMQLYQIALKEKDAAMKAAKIILQHDDILNKNSSSFLTEWQMILKKTSVSTYNTVLTPIEEEQLKSQMNQFPTGQVVSDEAIARANSD